MTNVFSRQNSVSLFPASCCIPRPNLPFFPGTSRVLTSAFQSPVMKKTSFFAVSSKRSCMSSQNHSTSQQSKYASTTNAEEAEVEWLYDDLQDFLELTPPKDVLFITGDWHVKVGSQEIPGITGKFSLGVQNKAGQRLTEFCQENALVIANTGTQETTLHMDIARWSKSKSD